MSDPRSFVQSAISASTRSLTFITTYKCTAACADCCFECSPDLDSGKLTFEFMKRVIDEARQALPSLQVVVFSGGECYMLKDHLFRTIAYATQKGLKTRTVTNGYWGKTPAMAERSAAAVHDAGLTEVNISTGLDHQQWVPAASVINAARALTKRAISTVITIEKDTAESTCLSDAKAHPDVQEMLAERPAYLKIVCNSWMPFKSDSILRSTEGIPAANEGCKQLFTNLVVTPHQVVSACCGLTFEHIPEMRLGLFGKAPLESYLADIAGDFLKIWIHVDGPKEIARKLLGSRRHQAIDESVHICQACAFLHQDPELRVELANRYQEFLPEVMQRFLLSTLVGSIAAGRAAEADSPLPVQALA